MSQRTSLVLAVAAMVAAAPPSSAQSSHGWGRFSLFAEAGERRWGDGTTTSFNELIASFGLHSPEADEAGIEYAIDTRSSSYSAGDQATRTSIYDAYVGVRTAGGHVLVRGGQMWLVDLGGLGAVGGLLAEYRGTQTESGLRWRAAAFAGVEPKLFEAGYESGVKKEGGYLALDGPRGRRHVLGYVTIRNGGLTERSVLTTLNFLPVGDSFFLYQAAEYDVKKPGGVGRGGLNYFFTNLRWAPVRAVELQTTYHHGRSVDARTITNDELNGRPVDARLAEGYLFESAGARLTFRVSNSVRFWAGAGRDRNNSDDKAHGRATAGLGFTNLLGSGLDVTAIANRIDRTGGSYDSWYASLGRSFGPRVYVSADYNSSLTVIRLAGSDGIVVETRPRSRRYSLSSNVNLSRTFSLLLSAERLEDDTSKEDRFTTGLVIRF